MGTTRNDGEPSGYCVPPHCSVSKIYSRYTVYYVALSETLYVDVKYSFVRNFKKIHQAGSLIYGIYG